MAQLQLTGITKQFDTTTAVHDFNLTVQDGEFITLLGPSGCGKTTTLRMIAGFIRPTQGDIRLGEQVITSTTKQIHLPPEARNMGMVFQSYAVWPHKNVFENIAYPLRLRRSTRQDIQKSVTGALRLVNMEGMDSRYPHQLSGGQQQRVALARALVMEPDVLLLDEPLSNLDAKLRERMRFEIIELQQRLAITVVYVTHDQEEAMAMSDRVVVLRDGVIQQVGKPEAIYKQPYNRFVAEFIGATNLLTGHFERNADGQDRVCLDKVPEARIVALIAENVNLSEGEPVQVIIRPEDITLTTTDTADVIGEVKQRVFLGKNIEYRVQCQDMTLRVDTSTQQTFNVGDKVGIQIQRGTLIPLGD